MYQSAVGGLLTVLHLKFDHPSQHQLKQIIERYFFCLNLSECVSEATTQCHTCQSLKSIPSGIVSQSTEDPPEVPGIRFAADVLRRERQYVFLVREVVTSYTMTSVIQDEKAETLRSVIGCLLSLMCPLDSPKCVVRCDPAPGFRSLVNDETLRSLGIEIDIGRAKNINKNPVAEQAVRELEMEILKQEPLPGPVSNLALARATSRLNSRIRSRGFSAREMWFQRDQYSNMQLPFNDMDLIKQQHESRTTNHPYSVRSKGGTNNIRQQSISVGDIVYLYHDKSKGAARPRYIVALVDGSWCFLRKFTGSQLREVCLKVKLTDCYKVPVYKPDYMIPRPQLHNSHSDDELNLLVEPHTLQPSLQLDEVPTILVTPPQQDVPVNDFVEFSDADDAHEPETDDIPSLHESDEPLLQHPRRSQRERRRPKYFDEYEMDL